VENAEQSRPPIGSGSRFWVAVLLVLIVFLLGGMLSRLFRRGGSDGSEHPAIGRTLPDLELQGLGNGASDVTLDDLKGNVALINFWGTWCPPCRVELPHIAKLGQAYADRKDFRLLAVSCGPPGQVENRAQLARVTLDYLASQNIDMPVRADLGETTRRAVDMALGGMQGYPTTILLDRNLTIRAVWVGYASGSEHEMSRQIQRLLATDDGLQASSDDEEAG